MTRTHTKNCISQNAWAFDRMLAERQKRGLPCDWQTGEDVMHWWMEDGVLPGQMVFEEMEDVKL